MGGGWATESGGGNRRGRPVGRLATSGTWQGSSGERAAAPCPAASWSASWTRGLSQVVHEGSAQVARDGTRPLRPAQLIDRLDNRDLRARRVQAAEGRPVIHHHTSAEHVAAAVARAGHERDLQEGGQLLHILHRRPRVHHAPLVRKAAVTPHQRVPRDRLSKHVDAQYVGHDVLRLTVEVCVHKRDVVVCCNHVAKRREALLDSLDHHAVRQRVPQVLQLLVCASVRNQEPSPVAHDSPADYPRASDRCLDHRNVISQLRLEHTIEVLAAANSRDAVTVRERGEDADLVRGLELEARSHCERVTWSLGTQQRLVWLLVAGVARDDAR
mmetsp:Transcript_93164/g.266207  ORF Transcript_93164/g.266207 Transcript_93164/m.266207 type:complete len:328 (-) Transcript_93164:37-1020(-)